MEELDIFEFRLVEREEIGALSVFWEKHGYFSKQNEISTLYNSQHLLLFISKASFMGPIVGAFGVLEFGNGNILVSGIGVDTTYIRYQRLLSAIAFYLHDFQRFGLVDINMPMILGWIPDGYRTIWDVHLYTATAPYIVTLQELDEGYTFETPLVFPRDSRYELPRSDGSFANIECSYNASGIVVIFKLLLYGSLVGIAYMCFTEGKPALFIGPVLTSTQINAKVLLNYILSTILTYFGSGPIYCYVSDSNEAAISFLHETGFTRLNTWERMTSRLTTDSLYGNVTYQDIEKMFALNSLLFDLH